MTYETSIPSDHKAHGLAALGIVLIVEVVLGAVVMLFCGAVGFLVALEAEYQMSIFLGFSFLGILSLAAPLLSGAIWYPKRPALAITVGGAPSVLALVWIAVSFLGYIPYR